MPFNKTLDHVAAVSLCRRLEGNQHAFAAVDEGSLARVVEAHLEWAQTKMQDLLAQHNSDAVSPSNQADAKHAMAFVQWLINQHLVAQSYLQTVATAHRAEAMTAVAAGSP
eukprot:m.8921 g.8921  ORF g.8921 m.8921 type:complete len:111 (-) comp9319_c0_seq2:110-442(-)